MCGVWCVVCSVVWCGVMLLEGKGQDVLLTGIAKRAEVCACARSVWHLRGSWVRPFVWRVWCDVMWYGEGWHGVALVAVHCSAVVECGVAWRGVR